MDKVLYTVAEVVELTGLSRRKVYDLLSAGTLRSVKIGSCRRVPAEALRDFVAALMAGTAA
jgi:excisionase family DNA binding protein